MIQKFRIHKTIGSKSTWGIVNSEVGNHFQSEPVIFLNHKDMTVQGPSTISVLLFSSYFINIVPEQIIPQIPAVISGTPHKKAAINTSFKFSKVTEQKFWPLCTISKHNVS